MLTSSSCERENKWLDEGHYAVDSSIIPRGGAKRRKSMEPRALSNVNGTLVSMGFSSTSAGRRAGTDWGTMEDFRRHSPPWQATPERSKKPSDTFASSSEDTFQIPKTPGSTYNFNFDDAGVSPATPFYFSQRSQLVQQTCPPKQTRQGLFSSYEETESEPNNQLRLKLEAARRKSLAFKPKIGSRLGQ